MSRIEHHRGPKSRQLLHAGLPNERDADLRWLVRVDHLQQGTEALRYIGLPAYHAKSVQRRADPSAQVDLAEQHDHVRHSLIVAQVKLERQDHLVRQNDDDQKNDNDDNQKDDLDQKSAGETDSSSVANRGCALKRVGRATRSLSVRCFAV